ncbi:efflux RND transporter periplasmic adaptor subunit [Fictibacillus iocasae]|uniref:Efflux RND transporter periplasmic adaptor subunit n=1 Tax=Fictibacillus iocasae TaxID=2715437 RepID=A0ABW2NRD9_9BACL
MKKRLILWSAAGTCLAVLLAANTYIFAESESSPVQEIRLQTVKVTEKPLTEVHHFDGIAVADEIIDVYPLFDKEASEWLVKKGDAVTEGDPLVLYSDPELESRLKEAEDALSEEEVKADYYGALKSKLESKISNLDEEKDKVLIEEISAQLSDAELAENISLSRETSLGSTVSNLQEKIQNLSVVSPISGTVQLVEQHSDLSKPIIRIHSSGSLLVKVSLSPTEAAFINEGDEVTWQLSNTNREKATVLRKQMGGTNEIIDVYMQAENATLTEGEPVRVFVNETIKKKTAFLPTSAVITIDQKKYVYTLVDGFLQKREVLTGVVSGRMVEIVKGAAKGEWAAVKPSEAYYHNQRAYNLTVETGKVNENVKEKNKK